MDYRTDSTLAPASTLETIAALRATLGQVMRIESHTIHDRPVDLIEFSGQLTRPSEEAFEHIYDHFTELGYTPMLTRRDGKELVIAQHGIVKPTANRNSTNLILLVLTIISTWFVGIQYGGGEELARLLPATSDLGSLFGAIFSHPDLWIKGLPYVLTLLGILGIHEMGHYVAARIHKAAVTLPYFIPLPVGLGTMGAVIRLKSPIKNRQQLFDIGVAGPLAGLTIAIPLLLIGLLTSPVRFVGAPTPGGQEGNSILYLLLKLVVYGRILPGGGYDVILNAIAFPAWFGLVVTMINLLPIGQLDGGHVLYAAQPRLHRRVALVFWVVVLGLGYWWAGWYVWAGLVLVLSRGRLNHPTVLDAYRPLPASRRALAWAGLVLFVLTFAPVPFRI